MAEKKIKRAESITPAEKPETDAAEVKPASNPKPAAPAKEKGSAVGYRIGAAVLWLAAIAFEVIAILLFFGKINWTFLSTLTLVIIALVLDLGCVIAGSLLWKKSNRIDPASKKNKVKFWLWNNMGLIVCAFAFIPFVILALTNKNADKKTKTVAVIVAIIACLIGGLFSFDWNPISAEEKAEMVDTLDGTDVYWTNFGTVYHLSQDCGHLNHSDELTVGSVEQAIEANRTRLCKDCEKHAEEYGVDLEKGIVTDFEDDGFTVEDADVTVEATAEVTE